jgi:hypothetical protein
LGSRLEPLRKTEDWRAALIFPSMTLRSRTFVHCFPGLGPSARITGRATLGLRPFWAFTIGVLVDVPLGEILSTVVTSHWARI